MLKVTAGRWDSWAPSAWTCAWDRWAEVPLGLLSPLASEPHKPCRFFRSSCVRWSSCFPVALLSSHHFGQRRHALYFLRSDLSILQVFTVLGVRGHSSGPHIHGSCCPRESHKRGMILIISTVTMKTLKEGDRGLWGSPLFKR